MVTKIAHRSPTSRSALSNGSRLLPHGIDGRSRQARRWRDIFEQTLVRAANPDEQLARTYSSLICQRELLDAQIASGKPADALLLSRLANSAARISRALGLDSRRTGESEKRKREDAEAFLD